MDCNTNNPNNKNIVKMSIYNIREKKKLRLLLLGSKEGDPWSWASGEKQDLGVLRLGRSQSIGSNVGKG